MTPTVAGDVCSLLAGVVALWLGARLLVSGASRLASAAGVSSLVIGLTVVAFGTSAPEVVVSTGAAIDGRGDVAVGNAIGSNLFNLGVILGLIAVLSPFRVAETLVRRDALAMGASTVLAIVALADGVLTGPEGAILVASLAGYFGALWLAIRRTDDRADRETAGVVDDPDRANHGRRRGDESGDAAGGPTSGEAAGDRRVGRDVARVLGGLVLVVGGGRLLVDGAVGLALTGGVSEWLVGATVVAAGTSLPELVTSAVAARRGEVAIAAGNVVGSNVFNALGVLGIAAVIRPVTADPAVSLALAWLAVLTAFATVVLATGRRLTRLEGVALLALGLGYWAVGLLG